MQQKIKSLQQKIFINDPDITEADITADMFAGDASKNTLPHKKTSVTIDHSSFSNNRNSVTTNLRNKK